MPNDFTRHSRESLSALDKEALVEVILSLEEQIERLANQTAKNSENSSQPPSRDGLQQQHGRYCVLVHRHGVQRRELFRASRLLFRARGRLR